MRYLKTFLSGILAGAVIGLGGFACLMCKYYGQHILGSIFFSFGLLIVCFSGLKLYTGQIGRVFHKKPDFLLDLLLMLIGNLIGAAVIGLLIYSAKICEPAQEASVILCETKESKSVIQILVSGFFCGVLVYIGVEAYKSTKCSYGVRVLVLMFSVAVFVLCQFDHVIANMFYLAFGTSLNGKDILISLFSLIGNTLGAILTDGLIFLIRKEKKEEPSLQSEKEEEPIKKE